MNNVAIHDLDMSLNGVVWLVVLLQIFPDVANISGASQ